MFISKILTWIWLAGFLLGVLLCYLGVRKSSTLKEDKYQPVSKADDGHNVLLIAGTAIMVVFALTAIGKFIFTGSF